MRYVLLAAFILFGSGILDTSFAAAQTTARFASLGSDKVNLRTGPGMRYPVEWIFVRKGWPVEIVGEFGYWRKIRDVDGAKGWVHQALLSSRRTVIVTGDMAIVHSEPDPAAPPVMILENRVIADLEKCDESWCRITTHDRTGWIDHRTLWGLAPAGGR